MHRTLVVFLAACLVVAACTAAPPASPPPSPAPGTPTPGVPEPSTTPGVAGPTPTPTSLIGMISELRAELDRAPAAAGEQHARDVAEADLALALALYARFADAEDGNLFFSPYSIATALSMAYAGARGQTAAQLAELLGVSIDDAAWHAARNAIELGLMDERPSPPSLQPIRLEPTNAIFGQHDFPFEQEYIDTLAVYYGAGMQLVDFVTQTEEARELINEWVSERTNERIPQLLPQDSIDDMTRFVLVNAIYFKANWIHQFEPDATRDGIFTLLDGSQVTVPLMHTNLRTGYARGTGWQAVSLPYAGGASMIVIVPDEGRYADVENGLDAAFVSALRNGLGDAIVDLGLPRWESSSTLDLAPALKALGVADLFVPFVADLTGIAPVEDLYVSAALHQANITVDEEGTEAAAATAIIGGITSAPELFVTLHIDRPFIYLIQDELSGAPLFVGRVLDPSAD
jgi:serpin B